MASSRMAAIRHFFCGVLMGAADAVPGISGGTVALILGIYRRLVSAISQVNRQTLQMLLRREWSQLAETFDLRFLAILLGGIVCGLLTFVVVLHELIGEPERPAVTRPFVYAVFFGAIAGSGVVVGRMVRPANRQHAGVCAAAAIAGAWFAWWLTGLPALDEFSSAPNPLLSFLLGVIAISAMILPGLSGSYLLLIFGAYHYYSGIPKVLGRGEITVPDLAACVCFVAGCVVGILTFSKFLRWLLLRYEAMTLAVMGGFMIGALRKLWPWQGDEVEPPVPYESIFCVLLMVAAAALVLGVDYWTRAIERETPET